MADLLRFLGLQAAYGNYFLVFVLVMCRMTPCVILAPFLGGKSTPNEIKMTLVMMFTLLAYPFVHRTLSTDVPTEPVAFVMVMLGEIFVGMTIGLVTNHVFYAIEIMGRIIDTARGSNMAEVMVPQMDGRATPLGDIYYQYAICLIYAIGGHRIYIDRILMSFEKFPLMKPIAWQGAGFLEYINTFIKMSGDVLLIAIGLAIPAVATTFVIDVVFGLLNRLAPQLNAYFMAMPVKAMGAIVVLFFSLSMISSHMEHIFSTMFIDIERVLQFIAG